MAVVTQNLGSFISLIRNGACNVRTLTPILSAKVPHSSISWINLIIGLAQGGATLIGTIKGVKLIIGGHASIYRLRVWAKEI